MVAGKPGADGFLRNQQSRYPRVAPCPRGAHHRAMRASALVHALVGALAAVPLCAQAATGPVNLAVVATPSGSYVSGDTSYGALNDGNTPTNSRDRGPGAYGNWPRRGTSFVEYTWSQPIATGRIEVY